jgi:hypothetical protein
LPVAAKVFIPGHDNNNSEVYSSANPGDYHRPIKAGTYTLEISAPCYQTQTISGVTVADHATLNLNIQMVPGPAAAVTTTAVTGIVNSTAVSGGDVTCSGNTAVTARGVCWSTTANPLVTGNHTTDGSGPGVFSSLITGLSPSTIYHVRAYATNSSGTYYGADVQFTSSCGTVSTFPWTEGFENGGVIPACWTQEQVNGSGINWVFITGNGSGYPATAHTGTYNACLKDATSADNKTRLITPPMNLANVPLPQLKFWHTQPYWSPDQDQLSVYYKTSPGGPWNLLATYTASITAWTQETLTLPNAGETYYIAFEGNAKYGRGVCVDDVEVSSSCTTIYPVSVTVAVSANPVCAGIQVTCTASPVNGGSSPVYQWKVNGTNAGTNSAVYTYTPSGNDLVTCVMTSNLSCTSGNPATSPAVAMTVNPVVPVSISIVASANPVDAGTQVTYTANPVNGGATPVYQWLVNGSNMGTNQATFTHIPVNGDVVSCILTSSEPCTSTNPATSNAITMTVNAVPLTLTIQNISVPGTECYNALQTIVVAGSPSTFTVLSGGSATLIAGENILFYPGTFVEAGGSLWGYVSPGGPWCNAPAVPVDLKGHRETAESNNAYDFRVYPNPTNGSFMLESGNTGNVNNSMVEIYNMKGELLLRQILSGSQKHAFSLSGQSPGIYLLRVFDSLHNSLHKIVLRD